MKKSVGMLLAIVILAGGCGNEDAKTQEYQIAEDSVKETETAKETEKAEETETAKEAETAEETEKGTETLSLAVLEDLEFYFASGAGAWRTILQVKADGSFSGTYSDAEMGASGEGYPNGTYYYCDFHGTFTEPVKVNDYTYSMKIKDISCANEPETTEIINETLYHYSTPYGMEGAEEILLFLPGAPTAELPEEYMGWVRYDMKEPDAAELPFYGLYNVTEQNGFSSYDVNEGLDEYMAFIKEQSDIIQDSLEHDTLTQADMNMKSQELYELWDDALNYLWGEVKSSITEEEFEKLLDEQRIWIEEKEKSVEEAGKEFEGGSIYALIVNGEAAKITEERVYELYELLK